MSDSPSKSDERAEFLADVLIGAVEGGTGYWAQVSAYRHTPARDARAVLHEIEPDEPRQSGLVLDPDAIARALGMIRRGEVRLNSTLRATIVAGDRANDAGDLDADACDAIAQVALLGEVVYG